MSWTTEVSSPGEDADDSSQSEHLAFKQWERTAWNTRRPSSVMNCSAVVTSSQGGGCSWLPDLAATAASTACCSVGSSALSSSSPSAEIIKQGWAPSFPICEFVMFSVRLSCLEPGHPRALPALLHLVPGLRGVAKHCIEESRLRLCVFSTSGRPARVPECWHGLCWAPLHYCLTSPASGCPPAPHTSQIQPPARPALRSYWSLAG